MRARANEKKRECGIKKENDRSSIFIKYILLYGNNAMCP